MKHSSSTAALEPGWWERDSVVGSTDKPIAQTVGIIPRSAGTLRVFLHAAKIPFALSENLRSEIYISHIETVTGALTFTYTEHAGSLTLESPTLRMIARPLQPVWPFSVRSIEFPLEQVVASFGVSSRPITIARVVGLDAAAQPITSRPALVNSTDVEVGTPRLVESKFAEAVALAREEWFEGGVESKFSWALSNLVHAYGDAAVAAVETFVGSPSTNIEIAVEAAKWLGEVDHPTSHRYRRTLLERLLSAPSTRLRHGAGEGLAAMDDPSSLPALIEARDRETNRRLRYYLELVVEQLERTSACLNS